MLAGAEEAVAKHRWNNVGLVEGDAAEIGYSASFDAALCTIAMTVIPDWQRALRAMIAAVRPDKRIVVMDGCRPSGLAGGPDFDDGQICIHDGYAEATGTLRSWGIFEIKFKLRGTVELTGNRLLTDIEDIDIGSVPDPLHLSFEGQTEDPIEEGLDNLGLEPHTYTVILTEGFATVEGQP